LPSRQDGESGLGHRRCSPYIGWLNLARVVTTFPFSEDEYSGYSRSMLVPYGENPADGQVFPLYNVFRMMAMEKNMRVAKLACELSLIRNDQPRSTVRLNYIDAMHGKLIEVNGECFWRPYHQWDEHRRNSFYQHRSWPCNAPCRLPPVHGDVQLRQEHLCGRLRWLHDARKRVFHQCR
jgi:hypothetical protein